MRQPHYFLFLGKQTKKLSHFEKAFRRLRSISFVYIYLRAFLKMRRQFIFTSVNYILTIIYRILSK